MTIVAFGISRTESSDSYNCLLSSVFDTLTLMEPSLDLKPDFIMSDFSHAINKSLSFNFKSTTFLKCRFHFWQIIMSKFRSYKYFPKNKRIITNPSLIPTRFKEYFNLRKFGRAEEYDSRRMLKYHIAIMSKLPPES